MAIYLSIVGIFVSSDEVVLIVKLNEGVATRLTLLIANDPHGLNYSVLLGGERLTSNSYFRVFYVVLWLRRATISVR